VKPDPGKTMASSSSNQASSSGRVLPPPLELPQNLQTSHQQSVSVPRTNLQKASRSVSSLPSTKMPRVTSAPAVATAKTSAMFEAKRLEAKRKLAAKMAARANNNNISQNSSTPPDTCKKESPLSGFKRQSTVVQRPNSKRRASAGDYNKNIKKTTGVLLKENSGDTTNTKLCNKESGAVKSPLILSEQNALSQGPSDEAMWAAAADAWDH